MLDKTIKIEKLGRDLTKASRKAEETERTLGKKIEGLLAEKDEESREREEHFGKLEKDLRQEIIECRTREAKLLGDVETLRDQIEILRGELKRHEEIIRAKEEEVRDLKGMMEKQREDHGKEITNLMKERKRRSSNLGSSRSLSSSLKESGVLEESPQLPPKKVEGLPTVREESPDKNYSRSLERSHITEEDGDEENELMKAVFHYDALI